MHPEEVQFPLCRHVKTNGTRCRSAAVVGQDFCYFHARIHHDHPAPLKAQEIVAGWKDHVNEGLRKIDHDPYTVARAFPHQNELNFPALEDAESVQLAGSMLFHSIAQGSIHPARARMLLSALKVVNSALLRSAEPPTDPAEFVRELEQSATGVALAPASTDSALPQTKAVPDPAPAPQDASTPELTPNVSIF